MNLSVSSDALMVLRDLAGGFMVSGARTGPGPRGIVPAEASRVVPGLVSRDQQKGEPCIELIDAGLCEPSLDAGRADTKRCYRVPRSGCSVMAKAHGEFK